MSEATTSMEDVDIIKQQQEQQPPADESDHPPLYNTSVKPAELSTHQIAFENNTDDNLKSATSIESSPSNTTTPKPPPASASVSSAMSTVKTVSNPAKREKALVKIIVLGCSNVGKTSIMERFTTGKFSGIRRPTVGADFLSKKVVIHDIDVSVQVWDTAGQERFFQGTIGSAFFRGAHGALLVYDANNERSIEQIELWRDECMQRQEFNSDFFPIVVIANKIDIRDATPQSQRVDQSAIVEWCRDNSYGHIETSAKDGHGVEAAMMAIIGLALESQRSSRSSPAQSTNASTSDRIHLSGKYEPKKAGLCC